MRVPTPRRKAAVLEPSWLRLAVCLAAAVLISPSSAVAAAYYVDPAGSDANDGSAARPWRTIQRAANGVNPGDTVNVRPGDYPEYVITTRSGTASARIRFVSTVRWGARLRHAGTQWQVWYNRASYIDIEGFDISGSNGVHIGIRNGQTYDEVWHARIIGNHVHDIRAGDCTDFNGGSGINDTGRYNVIARNHVHHIGLLSDTGCNLTHGIYVAFAGGRVENNIVHNNQGCGLHLYHRPREVVVVNNVSFHNGVCGLVVGGAEEIATGMYVANNILYDNLNTGMYENSNTSANTFRNNLVFRNPTNTSILSSSSISGTIVKDPQFVDYRPDGTGDYRLRATSPAIDAGIGTNAPSVDYSGTARPQGAAHDIGAFELGDPPAAPTNLRIGSETHSPPAATRRREADDEAAGSRWG
jgi:hypothetical protein